MMQQNIGSQLLLLVTRQNEGKIVSSRRGAVPFGLAAGIILDLLREKRLRIDEEQFLNVVDVSSTGRPMYDEVLQRIGGDEARRFAAWISMVHDSYSELLHVVYGELAGQGLVRHEESRVLGLFRKHRYPLTDDGLSRSGELRRMIVAGLEAPVTMNESVLQLCALIHGCRVEHLVLDGRITAQARSVFKRLFKPDLDFARYPVDVHRAVIVAAKATRQLIVEASGPDASA
jgi:hypothetical protein